MGQESGKMGKWPEGKNPKKKLGPVSNSIVVVSLGVTDHVHGRGGATPHINKKRGIVRIDGGIFGQRYEEKIRARRHSHWV
jgi:hypothetical protein